MTQELPQEPSSSGAPAIRIQLERLLAHPLFTNSKRYPALLSYTVEQTLLGNAAALKERVIGVEAFGRAHDYDPNLDPVVRTCAAEVRRRLVQYYYDPAHSGELVIELPAGSYIPAFRIPGVAQSSVPEDPRAEEPCSVTEDAVAPPTRWRRWGLCLAATAALILAFATGVLVGRLPKAASNVDLFWEPITSGQGPVTYCLGKPVDAVDGQATSPVGRLRSGGLDAFDVVTLARTTTPLVPRHVTFRMFTDSDVTFAQLREGPVVLIGAFDNAWTLRLTQDLPFGFEVKDGVRQVIDRTSPTPRSWTLERSGPDQRLAVDYAIVARIHDKTTGQPVIVIAGILGEGTEAASEAVYNPVYLDAILAKAPENWSRLNLEAVIRTKVIQGHPGPPEILAVDTW
jgi:hypothetical protein